MIAHVTSRLIVNRTALKTRPEVIGAWIARFRAALGHEPPRHRRPDFPGAFAALLARRAKPPETVRAAVAAIIADVRARGDAALLATTRPASTG